MQPAPSVESLQQLFHCEVVDPPRVEDGFVVLRVVDNRTHHVFACRMKAFGDVVVEPVMSDNVARPSATERAEVAEFVRAYAEQRDSHFDGLFSLLPDE